MDKRYFKIEGIIELPAGYDLDTVASLIILTVENEHGSFGGGIKEVDENGNDLK